MQKSLVSILTPCYNTGNLVHRLLDSVLMQDYPQVEMFCIDDGSTDNTREVVESYIPKFTEKGYTLTYVHQENGGQSVAVNNGLKLVNGEFLMWPDSDDYYAMPDIISQMVAKMEEGTYDMGRCRIQFVDEEDLHILSIGTAPINDSDNQFDNIVFRTGGIQYPPVGYILRMSTLDKTIPNREIYTEKSAGQNWQLMMPLSYHRRMFFLDVVGASVLARSESHSRGQFSGYEQSICKEDVYQQTVLNTLQRMLLMTEIEKIEYERSITAHFIHAKMTIAVAYGKTQDAITYMNEEVKLTGKKYHPVNVLICRFCNCKPLFLLLRVVRKILKIEI